MIKHIQILRQTGANLIPQLVREGKTNVNIKKIGLIIPGAVAAAGTAVTLDTKDNNAQLEVFKDGVSVETAKFNYQDTLYGIELLSAESCENYNDTENKEMHCNHIKISPENATSSTSIINYSAAPLKDTTADKIQKLNSAIAQLKGYTSHKTEYDPEELHTYGNISLKRDLPALFKFLEIFAPDSKFIVKIKDKLKKDSATSLLAFEAKSAPNKQELAKGFISVHGDSVTYHVDTPEALLIGEFATNIGSSKAYLKTNSTDNTANKNEGLETAPHNNLSTENTEKEERPTEIDKQISHQVSKKNTATNSPKETKEELLQEKITMLFLGGNELDRCIFDILSEFKNIKNDKIKTKMLDKALKLLQKKETKNIDNELESLLKEASKIDANLETGYHIYEDTLAEIKCQKLQTKINNGLKLIDDSSNHSIRENLLTELQTAMSADDLQHLLNKVTDIIKKQKLTYQPAENTQTNASEFFVLDDLSKQNKKIVEELMTATDLESFSLSYKEAENLLLDIGFALDNKRGTHIKFKSPINFRFNGTETNTITITAKQRGNIDPRAKSDIKNICQQFYNKQTY